MEHWQFLIQKQGDRSWQSLESPNIELSEGLYRVLARSNLLNTDVEVRVSYFSAQEVPPKRRVQQRSRRTNSEGLMAVIPFTHLKAGHWELSCSGNLALDMLTKSWQHTVKFQVLPQPIEQPVERLPGGQNLESNSPNSDSISVNSLVSGTAAKPPAPPTTADSTPPVAAQQPATAVIVQPPPLAPPTISDSTPPVAAQQPATAVIVQPPPPAPPTTSDSSPPVAPELPATAAIVQPPPTTGDSTPPVAPELPNQEEQEAITDQPVNLIWVKGETAEQILQNLIDLALPASEPLLEVLEDEKVEDLPLIQPPPPLSLTLDQKVYVTRWGETLTLNGSVELQEKTNPEDKTPYSGNFHSLELRIELRSPQGSDILTIIRQPLPNKTLPLTLSSAIQIPADCESQLILADIRLYGALTEVDEVKLLANQPFTITADVSQLLAATTAAKPSQPDLLDESSESDASLEEEVEIPTSLGLEFFNLVKALPTELSLVTHPFPTQPLPSPIEPKTVKKLSNLRSPQLPKLPDNPTPAPTEEVAVAPEPIEEVAVEPPVPQEFVEPDEPVAPMDPINLEQLVIKKRRLPILDNIFPYLKRLKGLTGDKEQAKNDVAETLESDAESENTPEVVVSDTQSQDEVIDAAVSPSSELIDESTPEVAASPNAESITEKNPYSSPLIKQWLQNQGYFVTEIKSQDSNTEINNSQTIPEQQKPASPPEIPDVDVSSALHPDPLEQTRVDRDLVKTDEMEPKGKKQTEQISQPPVPPPPMHRIKISPIRSGPEIVVDDTDNELEAEVAKTSHAEPQQLSSKLPQPLPIAGEIFEPLPIPKLHVPEGELIAGQSVKVRVELPPVSPQVVVKLWVEDCQTRWLLDGPHILTDLLPSGSGGWEVMMHLNIPFGCLEIRLEAIALHTTTQQESHKATVVKPVVPPDLPNLTLDELLGM